MLTDSMVFFCTLPLFCSVHCTVRIIVLRCQSSSSFRNFTIHASSTMYCTLYCTLLCKLNFKYTVHCMGPYTVYYKIHYYDAWCMLHCTALSSVQYIVDQAGRVVFFRKQVNHLYIMMYSIVQSTADRMLSMVNSTVYSTAYSAVYSTV